MAHHYQIGASQSPITLKADIHTVGLAASSAVVIDANNQNDPGKRVAHSIDATGDINTQSIGDYTSLKGKVLTVFTKISLTGTDATARQAEAELVGGAYTLNGGDDGGQTFTDPTVNYDDPNVILNFVATLT